jgi:hypothetical protein
LFLLAFGTNLGFSQNTDTLKVMVYNLLNYRSTTGQCSNTNNNPTTKENALEIIIDHTLPDVFVACEMGASPNGINAFTLMNSSLNKKGRSYYNMANYSTTNGSNLTNMLYYNSNKLVLESQTAVVKGLNNIDLVRLVDIYTLYYKDPNLAQHGDTTYMHFIAAHLKAGNTTADRNERAEATEAVMAYLDTINATGNYFFMGDFNLYSPTEPAFLDMVNYTPDLSIDFDDPANRVGNWSNNSSYADIHTQSTRTSGGCAAGGGMDDRFDFILTSDAVLNNTDKVEYIPNTYWALGQDGNRFNGTIKSPTNNSVPFYVANALYDLSDHLPVMMDIKVTLPSSNNVVEHSEIPVYYNNPVTDILTLDFKQSEAENIDLSIIDMAGRLVKKIQINNKVDVDVSFLNGGTYFMKFSSKSKNYRIEKLIKI